MSEHRYPWMGRLGSGLLLLLAAGWMAAWANVSQAEPYMAVREGYKCSVCHVNRTGGGKRTDFANVYMLTRGAASPGFQVEQEEASEAGGDESPAVDFPHGHLSSSFSVGADLRAGYIEQQATRENKDERFDRQAACTNCHAGSDGGGKTGELYLQADVIPERVFIYAGENLLPRVDTRELFTMLQGLPLDGYVKAGTFRLPTAFNRYYDDPFVHGLTGGNTNYISPRGVGVEAGIEPGPFSLSVSVTNAGFPEAPIESSAKRQAAQGYAVFKLGMIGATYMIDPAAPDENGSVKERRITGAFAGLTLGRFTGLIEDDWIYDPTDGTYPEMGLAEINYLVVKGHNVKLLYEFFDPDRKHDGDIRDRTSVIYEPFLYAPLQVRLGLRRAVGPVDDTASNYRKYFVELHAFY